jgi:hypothetical protein
VHSVLYKQFVSYEKHSLCALHAELFFVQEETGLALSEDGCIYRGATNNTDVGGSGKHYVTIFMQVLSCTISYTISTAVSFG